MFSAPKCVWLELRFPYTSTSSKCAVTRQYFKLVFKVNTWQVQSTDGKHLVPLAHSLSLKQYSCQKALPNKPKLWPQLENDHSHGALTSTPSQCMPYIIHTFMYSWTVFMPRMTCPTWDSMLHAETTRANDGSFINSCSWGRHFRSSDRSTLVPNRSILGPALPAPPRLPPPPELPLLFRRTTFPVESFESESDKLLLWMPAAFSRSSWRQIIINHSATPSQITNTTTQKSYLQTLLEWRSLVLGIFSNCGVGSVANACPDFAAQLWIPVLIWHLLHLRSNFHTVIWVCFNKRLCWE